MKKPAFLLMILASFVIQPFLYADGRQLGRVYQIDKAHKVIVISGKIQDKLSTGDRVYVKTSSGFVELVVTMPMMSVAKCRIPSVNGPDDFAKIEVGQEIYIGVTPSARKIEAEPASSPAGFWKEFWAPGQETNVAYHDEYEISVKGRTVSVKLKNSDGTGITDVIYSGGVITFTQKTSFDVKYSLRLSSDGKIFEGTAATPDKTVPIRWERISESSGEAVSGSTALDGRWMEFWAPGQDTNVTYHDIYLIETRGGISVSLEKEDAGNISSILFSDGLLSFTQRTAFDVKYRLKLDAAGKKLEGTATTPDKTVPIRWEKQ